MTEYQKYINALRKCAKEHENDRTFTGHIIVSDLCKDTANLLEALDQQPCEDAISRVETVKFLANHSNEFENAKIKMAFQAASSLVNNPHNLPPVTPKGVTVTDFADRCRECGREKVLDKIRAEIIENSIEDYKYHGCGSDELIIDTSLVLEIIDKYKAEREE